MPGLFSFSFSFELEVKFEIVAFGCDTHCFGNLTRLELHVRQRELFVCAENNISLFVSLESLTFHFQYEFAWLQSGEVESPLAISGCSSFLSSFFPGERDGGVGN